MKKENTNKELLIIIPAYNEEASISGFLSKLLADESHTYADILVINDASTDNTLSIVQKLNIPVISHPYNLGYGTALQTGYKYAVITDINILSRSTVMDSMMCATFSEFMSY